MKKYLRILLFNLMVGMAFGADAQIYIIDDNFADSAAIYEITLSQDGQTELLGNEAFKLPLWEEVSQGYYMIKRGMSIIMPTIVTMQIGKLMRKEKIKINL